MTAKDHLKKQTSDPFGLRSLEAIEPGYDGWTEIESALQTHLDSKRRRRRITGWLAVAASLVLIIGISLRNIEIIPSGESSLPGFATPETSLASVTVNDNIVALIGLSQNMEEQVKKLRQETHSMPAESAIYVAELEDLIAQVDIELSLDPDSIDLWGQRVNLMLDLAEIYQQQWQIDYGYMASL